MKRIRTERKVVLLTHDHREGTSLGVGLSSSFCIATGADMPL